MGGTSKETALHSISQVYQQQKKRRNEQGWSYEGLQKFNKYFSMVVEDRKGTKRIQWEEDILAKTLSGKGSHVTNGFFVEHKSFVIYDEHSPIIQNHGSVVV